MRWLKRTEKTQTKTLANKVSTPSGRQLLAYLSQGPRIVVRVGHVRIIRTEKVVLVRIPVTINTIPQSS
jgi:hypothetical protein